MKPIIEVKNLSKKYRYGQDLQPYYTLRDKLTGILKKPKRLVVHTYDKSPKGEFWALKDISFKVNEGEILGIIGPNGAGKSTLLKVLSQITPPTSGKAILRGRVGSLLEVGTGFHQELTGRENIYLNGAILGMSRREINKKFDEIVEFAGVEKFLDTPVKRYSSGMMVRLGFAIAAHLEPEILIIDEVLAVGDAEFQEKCLGKMDDVAKSGRTILFVSHTMAQIKKLCKHAIYLKKGLLHDSGTPDEMVEKYLSSVLEFGFSEEVLLKEPVENNLLKITKVRMYGGNKDKLPETGKPLNIEIKVYFKKQLKDVNMRVFVQSNQGVNLIYFASDYLGGRKIQLASGEIIFNLRVDKLMLTGGQYLLSLGVNRHSVEDYLKPVCVGRFKVCANDYYSAGKDLINADSGFLASEHGWFVSKLS